MQENPTYQAANTAAPIVEEHFERHLEEARKKGETDLAPRPDARAVAGIINATFWASFRPEEGRFPKISIAYLPPERAESRPHRAVTSSCWCSQGACSASWALWRRWHS